MPKIVQNYVLERNIGKGQFGDVFKGYNKVNNVDVAVKVVKRSMLKGKFNELLQNEIRVLRTCNNDNIIKLYDIKKTANNFYLMLEYCNEGDLHQYMKQKKKLTQDEAVQYLIQIINAFQTLVKNKIMHRDFKLANILKHNGNIQIADFGFSKLLGDDDYTSTMLGSPLNMAPQVLNGEEYDNQADIWSIGTVFYQILFGKPPYSAGNMIDLIQTIKTKPLDIPRRINNISQVAEDALRKMLIVDSKKRIEWEDLFVHPINHYLDDQIKKDLEDTLKGDGALAMNMSRFYIKNNMVISHPTEISKKEDLNNYAIDVAINGQKEEKKYEGPAIRRQTERAEDPSETGAGPKQESQQEQKSGSSNGGSSGGSSGGGIFPPSSSSNSNNETSTPTSATKPSSSSQKENQGDVVSKEETRREMEIRLKKRNANRVLHERNIYVFLAAVAEEAAQNFQLRYSELVAFLLVKKLVQMVEFLANTLTTKTNFFKLDCWEVFMESKEFSDILMYIQKEHEVFRMYFQSMFEKITNSKLKGITLDDETKSALNNQIDGSIDQLLRKVLREYCHELVQYILTLAQSSPADQVRSLWIQADKILDCLKLDQVFIFEDPKDKTQFNFKLYYEENQALDTVSLVNKVQNQLLLLQ